MSPSASDIGCGAREMKAKRVSRTMRATKWRRRLQSLGIRLGDDIKGDYSTLAQLRDPDGNLLTLATPPSRPYPAA